MTGSCWPPEGDEEQPPASLAVAGRFLLGVERRFHFRHGSDPGPGRGVLRLREDGVEALLQGLLEFVAVVAARMRNRDFLEDRALDPLDRFVTEDTGMDQFGAELKQADRGGLGPEADELQSPVQLESAVRLIVIHFVFPYTRSAQPTAIRRQATGTGR